MKVIQKRITSQQDKSLTDWEIHRLVDAYGRTTASVTLDQNLDTVWVQAFEYTPFHRLKRVRQGRSFGDLETKVVMSYDMPNRTKTRVTYMRVNNDSIIDKIYYDSLWQVIRQVSFLRGKEESEIRLMSTKKVGVEKHFDRDGNFIGRVDSLFYQQGLKVKQLKYVEDMRFEERTYIYGKVGNLLEEQVENLRDPSEHTTYEYEGDLIMKRSEVLVYRQGLRRAKYLNEYSYSYIQY